MHNGLNVHTYGAIALAAGVLAAGQPAWAQASLGLSPMRLELKATPASQQTGVLRLINESSLATRYRTEVLDYYVDDEGLPQYARDFPKESQFSCRQWLTINPMESELLPGGQVSVRFTMRVPEGIPERSYHCAAGFTSLPTPTTGGRGFGLQAAVRMIGAFYVIIGNPKVGAQIKSISLEATTVGGNEPRLRVFTTVVNNGLMHARGSGKVELLDSNGKVIETGEFPGTVVLPQREQRIPLLLKSMPPDGKYKIRELVNFGAGELQEATAEFTVPLAGK